MTDPEPQYKGAQVRLLEDIGPALRKGAVGVCIAVASDLYPNSIELQYPLSVVFTGLGRPATHYAPIEDIDPTSVPHHNAVALRLREVELVKEAHDR